MSLNKTLITREESETYLAMYSDWLALSGTTQDDHIAKASVYLQLNWTCTEVDWDDTDTLSDIIKEACSFYAYASYKGNLYPSLDSGLNSSGVITKESKKVGSLEKSVTYSTSYSRSINPRAYPDSLMSSECEKLNPNSRELTRV